MIGSGAGNEAGGEGADGVKDLGHCASDGRRELEAHGPDGLDGDRKHEDPGLGQ